MQWSLHLDGWVYLLKVLLHLCLELLKGPDDQSYGALGAKLADSLLQVGRTVYSVLKATIVKT